MIYALPKATQHVDGRDGISVKELLAHGPGSGLRPLARASLGMEMHLCVSERGEKGRGGRDVQEICTVMSSTGVFFAPKGWAEIAQWCFRCPVLQAELMLMLGWKECVFPRQRLVGWLLSDGPPSDKNELNSERE